MSEPGDQKPSASRGCCSRWMAAQWFFSMGSWRSPRRRLLRTWRRPSSVWLTCRKG